jgi:hypothetical protein
MTSAAPSGFPWEEIALVDEWLPKLLLLMGGEGGGGGRRQKSARP